MDLRAQVVQSLRWSLLGKLSGQIATWAITLIVIRILAPEDYGLVALASASAGLLFVINELGLSAGVIQQKNIDLTLLRQVFGVVIALNLACFLGLFLLATPIAAFYTQPKLVPLIRLLSCQFIFSAFTVLPNALLMREMRFRALSLMDLATQIAGSLVTLFLALAGFGVWSLAWGNLASVVLKSVLYNAASPFLHWPTAPSAALRETMTFGGFVTLQRVLWFVYSSADVFIVGKLLGKDILGQYAISYQFASLPMQKVNGIISAVTFPAYSRAHGRTGALRGHLSTTIRVLSMVAFPVFAGISVISEDAILVVLGDKWSPAIVSMQLLSLVMPLKMILSSIQTALNSAGRPAFTFAIVVVATLVIPSSIVAGAQWGLTGVAVAWVITFPCVFLFAVAVARSSIQFGIRDLWFCTWKPALASAVMYAVVVAAKFAFRFPASPGRLGLLIVLGVATYALCVTLFAREHIAELRVLIAA